MSVGAYLLASFAAYAVGNVMVYGFGIGVAVERGQKVDLLLRATPLPPAVAITAKVLNALIFSLLSITALIVYGVLVGGLHQNLARLGERDRATPRRLAPLRGARLRHRL